jgi:hypothetical protein
VGLDWLDVGRLCERPGCSELGAASYGMVAEDLLFWVDTLHPADGHDTGVLCRRHADAMVVPRGWTLDDRREPQPRLFRPSADVTGSIARPRRRRVGGSQTVAHQTVEQLELSATGTDVAAPTASIASVVAEPVDEATPWAPDFDDDDDLDGLLHVQSPLLARAFRGTGRTR